MSSLKPLIKGQRIRIDNHHRGNIIANDFNDAQQDVHIHKIYKEIGRKRDVEIRIPLNHERLIQISEDVPKNIIRELKHALDDRETREKFLRQVYDELRHNWNWDDTEQHQKEVANRIAAAFGLHLTPICECVVSNQKCIRKMYVLNDVSANNHKYYTMILDKQQHYFSIGERKRIAKYLRETTPE